MTFRDRVSIGLIAAIVGATPLFAAGPRPAPAEERATAGPPPGIPLGAPLGVAGRGPAADRREGLASSKHAKAKGKDVAKRSRAKKVISRKERAAPRLDARPAAADLAPERASGPGTEPVFAPRASPAVSAAVKATAGATGKTAAKAPEEKPAFSARGSSEYYMKHRRDHDAYAVMALDLSYRFDGENSVRVLQTATKYTVVPQGDADFLLDDTTLQYTRLLVKDWNGFEARLRPSLSVPTSRESGRQGIVSRLGLSVPITRKFASGRVAATYTPFYRYQINRFRTRIGGAPLREHSLGHTLALAYSLTERLAAEAVGQGQYNWNEQSPYAQVDARPQGGYAFGAGLSYGFGENVAVGAGYSQSDAFIRDGRYDVNLYDPVTSRYYLSLSVAL